MTSLYFNPSCSKCRTAVGILTEHGVEYELVHYLDTPPSVEGLRGLMRMLCIEDPRAILRTGEPIYRELGLERASPDELLEAIAANPILLERPIIVVGDRAVVARPPERVLELVSPTTPPTSSGVQPVAPGVQPRFVPVDGLWNLRDLGGYVGTRGSVRPGLVYRSDSLHQASPEGVAALRRLGIVTVLDLRSAGEREEFPGPLPSTHYPIQDHVERDGLDPTLAKGRVGGEQHVADIYSILLDRFAARFGAVLSNLAHRDRLPAIIHCAGGKDRTGLTVALLLSALGVDRETVLDDYATQSTGPGYEAHRELVLGQFVARGVDPEAAAGMLSAPRRAMLEALARLDERYGSIDDYLVGACGMTLESLEELSTILT